MGKVIMGGEIIRPSTGGGGSLSPDTSVTGIEAGRILAVGEDGRLTGIDLLEPPEIEIPENASDIDYDGSASGIDAANVQEAIDALAAAAGSVNAKIETIASDLDDINTSLGAVASGLSATNMRVAGLEDTIGDINAVLDEINGEIL